MFGTIRKHQTWLWVVIIGIMIFGLIQWQNSLGKGGNNDRGPGDHGAIDGRPITDSEWNQGHVDAMLNYLVNTREWPDRAGPQQGWNQTIEDYKQVFLARKLEQYNIHTDPDLVAKYGGVVIEQIGNGQGLTPDKFIDDVLKPRNISAEDFQRFLEHALSIRQLQSVVGDPGNLVTPGEIQSLYVQAHQERKVEAVFFSASNYLASIPEPSPAALGQFYTNQMAAYREPDQMQVRYVLFNITNFLPQAEKDLGTNLTAEAESAYRRIGTNALTFGKTPEEAKAKIRETFIRQSAITNAYSKAIAFQNELMNKPQVHVDDLTALAKQKGLEVKVTQPFDKEYGPSDIHLVSSFPVATLFNLSADEQPFVDGPVQGADGVYIIAFDKSIPSHVPSFEEIRSRMIADYRLMQATRLAQANGQMFAENATNGLAKGKSFAAVSADAKVSPVQLPPFSQSTESLPELEDHVDMNTFKHFAFNTPVGKASEFIPMRGGGFVVYVHQELPIDQAKMQADLPQFSNFVRQERENAAFQAWFAREANAALGNIPQVREAVQRNRS